jgi:hypothetical protein
LNGLKTPRSGRLKCRSFPVTNVRLRRRAVERHVNGTDTPKLE